MSCRVFRSLDEASREGRAAAVSIGNFDGVHAGHRALLSRNLAISHDRVLAPSVLTFDPHPTTVVAPQRAPKLLTTVDQRIALIEEAGIEQAFVLPFDRAFSELTPEEFARDVVAAGCHARAVLVGDNFRFGHGQAGDVGTLGDLGRVYGFETEIVPGVQVRGRMVSSTEVRRLVEGGDVSKACRLLRRPYWVEGVIVRGFGIGSKQTVPTLNLETAAEVLPARGVYITSTREPGGREWQSITNIGTRPTFKGVQQTIETFLLQPLEGATPSHIRVSFLRRVREERRFESPEALKSQILRDVSRAQAWFRRVLAWC